MSALPSAPLAPWRERGPALLGFGSAALAAALVCAWAGSPRLLGPFIASAGVIAGTAIAQRRAAAHTGVLAYALCALIGAAGHAWLPAQAWAQAGAALLGFALLRVLQRAHAPALALLIVVQLNGLAARDLLTLAGLCAALQLGAWLGSLGVRPA